MSHHRVYISRRDQKSESRSSELLERLSGLIVGLREYDDRIARILQNACYYSRAEGWVVNVGITRNVYKIGA